jgi:hypothetical protein
MRMTAVLILGLLLAVALAVPSAAAEAVLLWGRWEHAFTAAAEARPETVLAVELTAPSGKTHRVLGFWDGGSTWRVRFMPGEKGRWSFRTASTPAVQGLDGTNGSFECAAVRRTQTRFGKHGAVQVSGDGHYLQHADGTPFFWMGDTVWNGPLLATKADWDRFLDDRVEKRFSAIQFVTTQWRTAPADEKGQVAFTGKDRIAINPAFFQRLDERIDAINAKGLLAVPVLLWAIRGDENPGYSLPEDQAIRLAEYMVARYGAHHVAWILPGDGNYSGANADRWKRIGRAVFGEREHAPVTLHPGGMQWPYEPFRGEKWLDFIGYQSGHGDAANVLKWIHSGPAAEEWKLQPARPILNLEPPYEDHIAYESRKPHPAYNIRRACYWSLLAAPPAGLTYGGHGIWSWETKPNTPLAHPNTGIAKPWFEAKDLPGAQHMKHLVALFESLPWQALRPAPEALAAQPAPGDPAKFVSAARTTDGKTALFYLPVGAAIRVTVEGRGEWFDPRTGERKAARREGESFTAPDTQDWALVLKR